MYGIINRSIEEMVTFNYGEATWLSIKKLSNIDVDYFISTEPYDDDITYKLATAAATSLGATLSEVLFSFGEWWILRTSKEKYGSMMASGGDSLRDFLINLPNFHTRIMLIYPKLTPPEFQVSDITDRSLHIHYYSKREGLGDFVKGLFMGLSKMYETPIEIEDIFSKSPGNDHDTFCITWK